MSAGSNVYWSQLPSSSNPSLSLQAIKIKDQPSGQSVGGLSFDTQDNVYVAFQGGKGGANGGSIMSFTVDQASPSTGPEFKNGSVLVQSGENTFQDTPEFVLYLPD